MKPWFQAAVRRALILLLVLVLRLPASILLTPSLILGILVLRLLQFIKTGTTLHSVVLLKFHLFSLLFDALLCLFFFPFMVVSFYSTQNHDPEELPVLIERWFWRLFTFGLYSGVPIFSSCAHFLVPRVRLGHTDTGIDFPERVAEILGCIILWKMIPWCLIRPTPLKNWEWIEEGGIIVSEAEERIEDIQILGFSAKKWIEVAIFTFIGCASISLLTHFIVYGIQLATRFKPGKNNFILKFLKILPGEGKSVAYYATGMKSSVSFVFISMILLVIWVLYFGSNLEEETAGPKRVLEFGTATLISLFVWSVFWLLKTWVLLAWEANEI